MVIGNYCFGNFFWYGFLVSKEMTNKVSDVNFCPILSSGQIMLPTFFDISLVV